MSEHRLHQAMKSIDDLGEDLSPEGWIKFLSDIVEQCESRIRATRSYETFVDPDGDGDPRLD